MSVCPVCKEEGKQKILGKKNIYTLLYCYECRLRFSDPMTEHQKEMYEESKIYSERNDQSALRNPKKDWRFLWAIKKMDIKEGTKVLDIGCGDGGFLSMVQKRGGKAFGIDLDERAVRLATEKRGLENIKNAVWQVIDTFDWEKFDYITLFDVLEHVSKPDELIKKVRENLNEKGKVIVSVPRYDRFPPLFFGEVDLPPHHYTLWTHTSLEKLFKALNFGDISIKTKPFKYEDVYMHFIWKFVRSGSNKIVREKSQEKQRISLKKVIKQIIKLIIFAIIKIFNVTTYFMPFLKGHTLFLVATKRKD